MVMTSTNKPNRPKIVRQIFGQKIGVGHGVVAALAPLCSPGIAHHEALRLVIITDRKHGMAADDTFARQRHFENAGFFHVHAFEGIVDSEAKHEWITIRQATLHLGERAIDALITYGAKFFRVRVARSSAAFPPASLRWARRSCSDLPPCRRKAIPFRDTRLVSQRS